MKTIGERAKEYAEKLRAEFKENEEYEGKAEWTMNDVIIECHMSYEDGATDQKDIDIDKAYRWWSKVFLMGEPDCYDDFRAAMEED